MRREALILLATPQNEQHLVSAAMDLFIKQRTEGIRDHLFADVLPCLRFLHSTDPLEAADLNARKEDEESKNSAINGFVSAAGEVHSSSAGGSSRKRYRVGVMSNGYIDFALLQRTFPEFTNLLDFYLQAADAGAQKPSVVPFITVINQASRCHGGHGGLGGDDAGSAPLTAHQQIQRPHPASRILYVGDSYRKDVLGARATGMKAVWLVRSTMKENSTDSANALVNSTTVAGNANEYILGSLAPAEFAVYLKRLHNSLEYVM